MFPEYYETTSQFKAVLQRSSPVLEFVIGVSQCNPTCCMLCFVTSIVVSLQSRGVTSDKAEKGDGYAIDFEPSVYNPRVLKILGHDRTGTTMEQKILFVIYLSFKST